MFCTDAQPDQLIIQPGRLINWSPVVQPVIRMLNHVLKLSHCATGWTYPVAQPDGNLSRCATGWSYLDAQLAANEGDSLHGIHHPKTGCAKRCS